MEHLKYLIKAKIALYSVNASDGHRKERWNNNNKERVNNNNEKVEYNNILYVYLFLFGERERIIYVCAINKKKTRSLNIIKTSWNSYYCHLDTAADVHRLSYHSYPYPYHVYIGPLPTTNIDICGFKCFAWCKSVGRTQQFQEANNKYRQLRSTPTANKRQMSR